jgi:hypothetical protein
MNLPAYKTLSSIKSNNIYFCFPPISVFILSIKDYYFSEKLNFLIDQLVSFD